MKGIAYLDSSALVKLIVKEPETAALRRYLGRRTDLASSALARIEVVRAVRPSGPAALRRARALLRRIDLIRLDDALLDAAAAVEPSPLRSLDAIHLASAFALGEALEILITYDSRMQAATSAAGLETSAPR